MNKFILNFAELCLRIPLLEMASERNEKMLKIQSYSDVLNKHLFKLYVFQKSRSREHWIDEIETFISNINNLDCGKKHKKFTLDEYIEIIFLNYFYNLKNGEFKKINYKSILNKYSDEYVISWSEEEFRNLCERFYNYIFDLVSKDKYDYELLEEYLKNNFYF